MQGAEERKEEELSMQGAEERKEEEFVKLGQNFNFYLFSKHPRDQPRQFSQVS